jgi:hypothetical protein
MTEEVNERAFALQDLEAMDTSKTWADGSPVDDDVPHGGDITLMTERELLEELVTLARQVTAGMTEFTEKVGSNPLLSRFLGIKPDKG